MATQHYSGNKRTPINSLWLAALLALCAFFTPVAKAADVNVLIVADRSVDGAGITNELKNILGGAGVGTVNVTLENTHKPWYGTPLSGRNLATWYHETGATDQSHLEILANLRGELGTVWDYVVLLEDRETLEKYPGQYCVGVSDIVKEVNRGTNGTEVVLMAQWPAAVSTNRVNTVAYYNEVAYRVGNSLGLKVAPAGKAWETAGTPAGATEQAYIAAASIYSRIWNQSATNSTYTFTGSTALAQTAFTTVTNNIGQPQYSGAFTAPIGIYNMGHVNNSREYVLYPEYYARGSTEGGFVSAGAKMLAAARLCYAGGTGGAITRSGPVGNASSFAAEYTSYMADGDQVIAKLRNVEYCMDGGYPYGADYYASRMASGYPYIRHWPELLMFAQYRRENSYNIMTSGQHISTASVMLRNAYLITLKTGRCPLPAGPANYGDRYWDAVRIGYETAWRISTLQGRAPGFKSLPSNRVRWTVDEVAPETMEVYFLYPPKSNVTVTVSTDQAFASVSPQTLTFTPTNYATPQHVTVSVAPGTAPATPFTVAYSTSSGDEVYDGLEESWNYQVNRRPIADNQSVTAYSGFPKEIYFTGSDPDADLLRQDKIVNKDSLGLPPEEEVLYNESHGYRIINAPSHGTIKILGRGDDVTYTADEGYTGPDSFTFVMYDWHTNSISEEATVTINVEPQPLYNFNLLKNGEASLSPFNEFHWTTQSGAWNGDNNQFSYTSTGLLYQDVDVADYAFDIDDGRQVFTFSGLWRTTRQWYPIDDFRFILEFRGATNQVLETWDSGAFGVTLTNAPPELYQRNVIPPAGTRSIRVIMQATRNSNNSHFADDLQLVAKSGINSAPLADYQSGVLASAGVTNTITLTASDADADALTYIIVAQPQHGTVTVNGTGPTVSYVPNAGYLGPDSFTFKVNDIRADSNVATIETIVVANVAPSVAIDSPTRDTVAIPYNVGVLLEATVVDDGAPAPATITWSKVSGPGAVTFESPNAADTAVNFNNVQGVYVLKLTAADGEYSVSDTVTIEVGYYDASKDMASHVIIDHHAVGTPGVAIAIDGVTIADDGLPNPPATVAINWELLSGPGNVVLSDRTIPNPTVTCDAAGQYIYRVSAFDGATKTYNDLSVTISGSGNLPPVAQNQTVEVGKNSTDNPITLTSTDAEGDPRTYVIVSQPSHGSVTLIGSGPQVTYTPTAEFGGNDSFTFKANDGADSAPGTVTIKVKTPPVVNAGVDKVVYLETGSRPWTPADIANTTAWYDADDASTVTESAGVVSQWKDKSGNGLHLSQSTGALQPATGATINSLNAINFTGNIMATASNPFGATINNAFVIAVHKVDSIQNGTLFSLTGTDTNRWQLHAPYGDGKLYFDCGGVAAPNRVSATYGVSAGSSALVSFYCSTAAAVQQVYKNGTLLIGDTSGHAVSTSGNITVGGLGTGYQDTTLGEFIIINGTVDIDTRQKLEGYLAHKWGLTNSLPAGHPYKSAAPVYGGIPTVNLAGTATDANGDALTTAWTVTEGVATVNNPAALNTTASVTDAGFYTFRLTADDGTFQPYDDVRIEVRNIDTNNAAPVAQDQSIRVDRNSAGNAIVLAATDAEGDALTYTLVGLPTRGTLSGTAPNLTYTPNTSFSGTDTFTFTASDFQRPSAPGTVTITVNSAPVVNAGPDQTVALSGSVATPWTPANIATAVWYDGPDTSTITASSGAVSQWRDKSGNGLHLNQATASLQPATGSTINSLNAIDFTGDIMATASNPFGATINNAFVIAVHKVDAAVSAGTLFSLTGSGANRWQTNSPWSDGTLYFDCGGVAAPNRINASYGVSAGSVVMTSFYSSTAANVQQVYKNGTLLVSDSSGHAVSTAGNITVGGLEASYQDTTLGEFITINGTVDVATRQKLEGYLAHKWGQSASLPSGHPYKSAAPMVDGASVSLDGTVYDPDGDAFTTAWSLVSTTPSGLPSVSFADTSAVDTTATFTQVGQYTLRLTATEAGGGYSQSEVTINVVNGTSGLNAFNDWITGGGGGGGVTFTGDSNSDGLADGMGWLIGAANPTQRANDLLPQSTAETNGDLTLSFKMLNSSKRGTAVIRLERSRDLGVTDPWTANVVTIPDVSGTVGGVAFTITPISGTDHNQVTATIPAAAANGTGKLFVRLNGALAP